MVSTFLLLSLVGGIISFIIFGESIAAVIFVLVVIFFATVLIYLGAPKLALRATGAKKADPKVYRRLYNLVEGLTIASGLPMPTIHIVDNPSPNAFATGKSPDTAHIAVTTGLLQIMNRVELEGVLAHELSHVKNYDIRVQSICMAMVGSITFLGDTFGRFFMYSGATGGSRNRSSSRNSDNSGGGFILLIAGLLLSVAAPMAALLLKMSLSREREYLADVSAINMTRYPPGLISALNKLKSDTSVMVGTPKAAAHLWIESPLPGKPSGTKANWLDSAFNTHPDLDSRIAILEQL